MIIGKKVAAASAVLLAVTAFSVFPAFAHGYCRTGDWTGRYPVCTEEGCQEIGRHVHDGKVYCSQYHENGYCDGTCIGSYNSAGGGHHRGGCFRN